MEHRRRAVTRLLVGALLACFAATAPAQQSGPAFPTDRLLQEPSETAAKDDPAQALAAAFAALVEEAIPQHYAKEKDWGQTKSITTGLRGQGRGLRWKLEKRKREVNHGVWKRYRIDVIDPEKNLRVHVEQLASLGPGRAAISLSLAAKLHGWAQAKIYNRGLHVVAVTGEGETRLKLRLDCEVAIRLERGALLPVFVVDPVVRQAKLELSDFRLDRFGELRGPLAKELSSGLRHVVEESLEPPKLTRKLNRAIAKKRDRLRLSGQELLVSPWGALADLSAQDQLAVDRR